MEILECNKICEKLLTYFDYWFISVINLLLVIALIITTSILIIMIAVAQIRHVTLESITVATIPWHIFNSLGPSDAYMRQ